MTWIKSPPKADIGRRIGIDWMEVTDEAFESSPSVVFDQAEDHMPSIKAILVAPHKSISARSSRIDAVCRL